MKLLHLLLVVTAMLTLPLRAEKFDLSVLKCRQLLQASDDNASAITAWLVGYYTEPSQAEVVDLERLKDTRGKLVTFCAANPNFVVSAAAEGLLGK